MISISRSMDTKNIQLQISIFALASLVVLITVMPHGYGQEQISQQNQQRQKQQENQTESLTSFKQVWPNVHPNVATDFNSNISTPNIEDSAFIHPFAVVIGDCYIGQMVMVAPTAVCRGDEGTPMYIGAFSNMQDGVVVHGLETTKDGQNLDDRRFASNGDLLSGNDNRFDNGFSVFVGDNVSLAHGSLIHGPAYIGNNTFVGMDSMVFNAKIGNNVAIGVASTITGGVEVADNKFVPPGSVITTQEQADQLPERFGSSYENINEEVVHVNEKLEHGYEELHLEDAVEDRERTMEETMMETNLLLQ